MLKTRVITALIGFIIAVLAITVGGYLFNAIILLLALLGWREYASMLRKIDIVVPERWGYVYSTLLMIMLTFGFYKWAIMVAAAAAMTMGLLYIFGSARLNISVVSCATFGFFYINGGFAALLMLRDRKSVV